MKVHLAGCFAALLCSAAASAAGGNITGVIGYRQLDQDQWSPTDTQGMLGVLADFSYWDFPLHIELGLRGSADKASGDFADLEQSVGEFSVGAVLIPDYGYMRPYFAFGLAAVTVQAQIDDNRGRDRDDDSSTGAYIGGGILWRLTPNFDLGFDARYLGGTDMRIFGNNVDVDSYTLGMRIGYGWDWHRRDYDDRRAPSRRPRRY
jgi:opacity protein-like surface antigen